MLEDSLGRLPNTRFLCLGTVDGKVIAFATTADPRRGQRISALSSSLLGLAETFIREGLSGTARYSLISCDGGSIVTVRIPSASARYALSLGADARETVALALRHALDVADDLARTLS